MYFLRRRLGKGWIETLLEEREEDEGPNELDLLLDEGKLHGGTLGAIQRKLGIGYNKAARLVEQMEEQGLVSPANHVGKREILVPASEEVA